MAIKETNFTLDLTREGKYPVVKFRLNDNKVQKITFRLTNDGRDVDLEKEMGDQFKPVFECIFRDKTFKRDENKNNWEIKREGKLYTFTYYLTNEVIDQSGIACYYFALETPEGLRISTPTLKMVIDCDFKEDGKPSDNYVSDFEKLLEEAEKVKQKIKDLEDTLNEVIENGGSVTETIEAREDIEGIEHPKLKDRLNKWENRTKDTEKRITSNAKGMNKAIITFTFDDGYAEDDLTFSIFRDYNMACSFALVRDRIFERNRLESYRSYEKQGFSVCSHASTHSTMSAPMDDSFLEYEVNKSAKDLRKYGLTINGFVTPMSTFNPEQLDWLREEYDYAFTVYKGSVPADGSSYMNKNHDPYKMHRVSLSRNSIDKIKLAIDVAIENKGLLSFYDHRTGAPGENVSEAFLREVLSYINSKVKNNECLVLNNDDAVSTFFGITLRGYKEVNPVTTNEAPSFKTTSTSAATIGTWAFSKHGTDVGDTFSVFVQGSRDKDILSLKYPNGMPIAKENSIQTRINLKTREMNKSINQNVLFSVDLWDNSAENHPEVSLEVRFMRADGTYFADHKKIVNITNKRQTFEFVASPTKIASDFEYALVYFRVKSTTTLPSGYVLAAAAPVIGFGVTNQVEIVEDSSSGQAGFGFVRLSDGITPGTPLPTKKWINLKATADSQVTVTDGDNSSFKVRESGLYTFVFSGNYEMENVSGGLERILIELTTKGWDPDDVTRSIVHFNTPNDKTYFDTTYILYLEKDQQVFCKFFADFNSGTVKTINLQPQLRVTHIPQGLI